MLYERWRKIAAERRGQPALRDAASGRRWTFGELLEAGEARTIGPAGTAFPQGHSPEFILDLLAAWRENKMVCPLEPGQGGASVLASRKFWSARTHPRFQSGDMSPQSKDQKQLVNNLAPPIVHLKCTSATTGAARVIAFTHAQLAA